MRIKSAQEEHDEEVQYKPVKGVRQKVRALLAENEARSLNAISSSKTGLVEELMQKLGVTRQRAEELLHLYQA